MSRRPSATPHPRHKHEGERGHDLLAELRAIYTSVDRALDGSSCPASTECCRFGITGREPYVTSIELSAIERAIRSLGGPRALRAIRESSARPPAHAERRLALVESERPCPLLSDTGRCTLYADRPLGCRTFYCNRATRALAVTHADITSFVRRIQDLAARHTPGGDIGRPLTRALAPLLGSG